MAYAFRFTPSQRIETELAVTSRAFLYDHLGGRKILPPTYALNLRAHEVGVPLKDIYRKGFEYSDCWVEDSRLVVLNARDAEIRGATIKTRTRVEGARRVGDRWIVDLKDMWSRETYQIQTKAIINCGGPWVSEIIHDRIHEHSSEGVRLVRGSHIVTKNYSIMISHTSSNSPTGGLSSQSPTRMISHLLVRQM